MKVEHIGIAVKDLDRAVEHYKNLFPEAVYYDEPVADGSMKMVIVKGENIKLELMQPLKEDCAVGKFIAKNGEGMHHIAFEVEDINQSMENAKAKGIRLITAQPYQGAEGHMVCFMHPKDTYGVLSEFCQ